MDIEQLRVLIKRSSASQMVNFIKCLDPALDARAEEISSKINAYNSAKGADRKIPGYADIEEAKQALVDVIAERKQSLLKVTFIIQSAEQWSEANAKIFMEMSKMQMSASLGERPVADPKKLAKMEVEVLRALFDHATYADEAIGEATFDDVLPAFTWHDIDGVYARLSKLQDSHGVVDNPLA